MSSFKSTVISIFAIFLIVFIYFVVDFNQILEKLKGDVQYTNQEKDCDLRKSSCRVVLEDGLEFILDINPKHIPLMESLEFSIKSNKDNLENINLNIYATNMFMGEFYMPLKNLGNGNYKANGMLPTCPVGSMNWNIDIKIEKPLNSIGARFNFDTE
jgi:hypothetical protein